MKPSEQSWERRERTAFFHTVTDLPTIREDGVTVIERGEGIDTLFSIVEGVLDTVHGEVRRDAA